MLGNNKEVYNQGFPIFHLRVYSGGILHRLDPEYAGQIQISKVEFRTGSPALFGDKRLEQSGMPDSFQA